MKTLGYTFICLGTIALLSVFFGHTHHIMTAVIGLTIGHAIVCEIKKEEEQRKE